MLAFAKLLPTMKYSFSLLFFLLTLFAYSQPCGSSSSNLPTPNKCFEIVSILVDACDGSNEGQNEMIRIKVGSASLLVSQFSVPNFVTGNVNWGAGSGNLWRGFCNFNASSLNKINSINTTITNAGRCGKLIPLNNNQFVPANGELLIITSTDFNPTAQSFANLNDTLYIVLQCAGNTAGHFANYGTSSTRRLILNHTLCSDTVIYNRVNLLKQDQTTGAEDGGAVNFSYQGTPTYVNNGCAIPITPIIFDAGVANANYCQNQTVNLSGSVSGTNCYYWEAKNPTQGAFNDSSLLNPIFTISATATGQVTLYLKINNACALNKDSVSFMVGSSASSVNIGNDTNLCVGKTLALNPSPISGNISWSANKSGSFSSTTISNPVYTPAANETGITRLFLQVLGSCGNAYDTLNINYIALPNPNFATPTGVVCEGSAPFNLIPITAGGQFYGNHLTGNTFNPSMAGSFSIKYVVNNMGCADSSSKNITVIGKPNPSFNIPLAAICAGSAPVQLIPVVAGGIFSGTGVTGNTFNPTTGGAFPVKYIIGNSGCLDSSTIQIQVIPKPLPSFSPTLIKVCERTAPIALNPLVLGGTFSGSQYIIGNSFNPILAGTYTLMYTIEENGCTDSSTQQIVVDPMPNPGFTLSDTLFCSGDAPGNFTAVETGGIFEGNQVNVNQFMPINAGIFVIKHTITKGVCKDSSELTVRVVEKPTADFSFLPANPMVNETVQFTYTGQGATEFNWEFGDPILGSSDFENPSFTFFKSGNFAVKLSVYNETCNSEISKDVNVTEADSLFMPNVFTPNGDGLNEQYGAVGFGIKEYNLFIYNRWGELLYTSEQINQRWDGRYREKECAEGVYFFILTATSNAGRSYNLNGTLQLLR